MFEGLQLERCIISTIILAVILLFGLRIFPRFIHALARFRGTFRGLGRFRRSPLWWRYGHRTRYPSRMARFQRRPLVGRPIIYPPPTRPTRVQRGLPRSQHWMQGEGKRDFKDYIENPLVIYGDYIEGDKTEIKDSIIHRSRVE